MAWSGRQKHRDRDPGVRHLEEPASSDRVFRMRDEERQQVAALLRRIDEARLVLEAQHDARNRQIVRELRAAADEIYDLLTDLEELVSEP